ncbi:MAG TPA: hypothetical protein VMW55_08630 [Nitrosopumilaceae archaeon]|jgi:hypothetical protein|nr:hypothetical protein [Nitrosopumilaceae archaeon]
MFKNFEKELDEQKVKEIIEFFNYVYDKEVPRPIKFLIRKKIKKMVKSDLEWIPDYIKQSTIEELIFILKDSYEKKTLKL